jgi:hypothetical protein
VVEDHRSPPRRPSRGHADVGMTDADRVDADKHLVVDGIANLYVDQLWVGAGVEQHRGAGVAHWAMLNGAD